MEFKDYYTTLGVAKTASDADIKRAYRKLARQFHPDLNPGDKKSESRFKEINEANEVLGDPDKRKKYDELGANWRDYERAAEAGGGGFRGGPGRPGGSGGGYRTMTPEEVEAAFGGQDPFSDFFHTFFSGGAGGFESQGGRARAPRSQRGHDVEQMIDLTLDEAFGGTTRRIISSRDGAERSFEVRIPAGVKDGARVRAAGEGGPGSKGGDKGDLYLTVRLLPHRQFERRGQDLHTKIEVPVPVAVLGGEVPVPTLGGSPVRLKVPELTTQGRVFRLRSHGVQAVGKPDERGDLYATVQLTLPSSLSDEERTHYEALKQMEDERRRS
jgi:DnaJ-class molecular chaperone